MNWIDINDSLPEDGQYILINIDGETKLSCFFAKNELFICITTLFPYDDKKVTHWMPVPKYSEKEKESYFGTMKLKLDVDLYNELSKRANAADLSLSSFINAILIDYIEMELDISTVYHLGKDDEQKQT